MSGSDEPINSLLRISGFIHSLNKTSEDLSGLTLVQWLFLDRVMNEPASSPQKLAENLSVHPSTLTQTMKRLEKRNLIFTAEDPKDSRRKIVVLTRKGKETLDRAAPTIQEWSRQIAPLRKEIELLKNKLSTVGGLKP